MTSPESLATINPDTGLAPCEVVCPTHNLTYNRQLKLCPECKDDSL